MKIAFIGGFAFSPKGTIRARAYPLAVELAKRGDEVTIFLPPYDNVDDEGREWDQEGVKIRNVVSDRKRKGMPKSQRMHLSNSSYPRLLRNLVHAVEEYHPELVHVFKPKGFAGAAGAYFLMKRLPLVLDCDDWEGWGGWNEVKRYPWVVKEYIDIQERWMIRRAPAVTVASKTLEERAIQLRRPRDNVYYLPNCAASGANLEIQSSVRAESQSESRTKLGLPHISTVLFSGHPEEEAELSSFMRTVSQARKARPLSVVIVGSRKDSRAVRELASDPRVHISCFPHLPYEDFIRAVWASDVTVFPYADTAVHRAKCSARILDYMAMGKPVLTSALGQNLEYIVDGESGFLVPPGDDAAMAATLSSLIEDPALCDRIGKNAEARVRSKFQWNGYALQSCLAAYRQVCSEHRSVPLVAA